MTLDANGIHQNAGLVSQTIPWEKYWNIVELKDRYIVRYIGSVTIIPRRAFTPPEQARQFQSLVSAHLKARFLAT